MTDNNIKNVLNKLNIKHKEFADYSKISSRMLCHNLKRKETLEELVGFLYFLRMENNIATLEMENIELLIDDLRREGKANKKSSVIITIPGTTEKETLKNKH